MSLRRVSTQCGSSSGLFIHYHEGKDAAFSVKVKSLHAVSFLGNFVFLMMLCSCFLTHPFAPPISWPDQLKFACYGPDRSELAQIWRQDTDTIHDHNHTKKNISMQVRPAIMGRNGRVVLGA